ncbi:MULTISPECIES: helix-turn-helix transcriptional regulator [unclassified Rhodococcus (in: high G+C Gram-positive bacteria)]|uniref:helix-turn-helix domain-containing protein n=1 Tax=unclassified Rhodococcus (in: high G+C Gram-positive bacteria) TaxID=192944 RepID=UPI0015962316|nr:MULTISPECIES: helix-turn-helix transcriptional regulator [unclassified Rhodococcus (in: high G+C Gram-positive bacteria)]
MQVRDPELIVKYMDKHDFSQARLARYCGCSRQFIFMLINGKRTTCTRQMGELIEEALDVLPGTLFVGKKSPTTPTKVAKRGTRTTAKAA